jgi:putative oxidoreductase
MTATTYTVDVTAVSAGLLVGRLLLGLAMAAHGSQKLFRWFGGYGLDGTGGFLEQLGFHPGRAFAAAVGTAETVAGLLVALGLLGPVGPALMLSVMVAAAITVHWRNGFFAASNGIEVPFLYSAGAVGLALAGYGRFSLDALLGLAGLWTPRIAAGALAVGVAGGLANVLARRSPASAPGAATS